MLKQRKAFFEGLSKKECSSTKSSSSTTTLDKKKIIVRQEKKKLRKQEKKKSNLIIGSRDSYSNNDGSCSSSSSVPSAIIISRTKTNVAQNIEEALIPMEEKQIVKQLYRNGYCIMDDFLELKSAHALMEEIVSLSKRNDTFAAGRVGSKNSGRVDASIRSDLSYTFSRKQNKSSVIGKEHFAALFELICARLVPHLNKGFKKWRKLEKSKQLQYPFFRNQKILLLSPTTANLTIYKKDTAAYYVKHLDSYRLTHPEDDDGRILTILYYLNPHWKTGDGGILKLYLNTSNPLENQQSHNKEIEIEPIANRLLLFWSDCVNHEVLPTTGVDRYAFSVWIVHKQK